MGSSVVMESTRFGQGSAAIIRRGAGRGEPPPSLGEEAAGGKMVRRRDKSHRAASLPELGLQLGDERSQVGGTALGIRAFADLFNR